MTRSSDAAKVCGPSRMDTERTAPPSPPPQRTYVYLWTCRRFQREQGAWDDVNRLLQHHGFKPVCVADPAENKNPSDLVLLDERSAGEIRATLRTMLLDSDRRQALIQELNKSNNHLKEEVQEHVGRAAQQSQRATELEGLLDGVKSRVQDLEDRYLAKTLQHRSLTRRLQQEKEEAQKECAALKLKLARERERAARLQSKLYFTIKEEERQTFSKRVGQHNSAAERQSVRASDRKQRKTYQEQQKESGAQMEELRREAEQLRREREAKLKFPRERGAAGMGDRAREAHSYHLLTEITAVVNNPDPPVLRQKPSASNLPEFGRLLPTLEVWAQQLHLLKELQRGLTVLTARLVPGPWSDGGGAAEAVKVEDMMLMVDTMLESTSADEALRSPTRYTLGSMVSHFQKLFDVSSLSGVYPRMNEVYTRLGEMTNAMKNLRDVLDLDGRAPPAQVVNQVTRMVSTSGHAAGLRGLLGDADIDSIIVKVKQHEEFFPPFHALIVDILQILGVRRLDDVLPALESLTQAAQ